MYELPLQLSNDVRFRTLENCKKFPEILGFDGELADDHLKGKF